MTFYELEKKCKERRIKVYGFIAILGVLVFSIIIYLFVGKKDTQSQESQKVANENKLIKPYKSVNKEDNINKEISFQKESTPSKNNITSNSSSDNLKMVLSLKIPEIINNSKEVHKKEIHKTNVSQSHKNKSVVEVESLPSYEKCIELAKKYLREEKYNLALKWAKNANIQNKDLPESWIITAEALFFSGQQQKAIDILKLYLRYHNDKRVKKLLKELENENNN